MLKLIKIKNFRCIKEKTLMFDQFKRSIDLDSGKGRTTALKFVFQFKEILTNGFDSIDSYKWSTYLKNKEDSVIELYYIIDGKEYIYQAILDFEATKNKKVDLFNKNRYSQVDFFKEEYLYVKDEQGFDLILSRNLDGFDVVKAEDLDENEISQMKMLRIAGTQSMLSLPRLFANKFPKSLESSCDFIQTFHFYKKYKLKEQEKSDFDFKLLSKSIKDSPEKINELLEFMKEEDENIHSIRIAMDMMPDGEQVFIPIFNFKYEDGEVELYHGNLSKSLKNVYELYATFFDLKNEFNNIYFVDDLMDNFSFEQLKKDAIPLLQLGVSPI